MEKNIQKKKKAKVSRKKIEDPKTEEYTQIDRRRIRVDPEPIANSTVIGVQVEDDSLDF